MVPFGRMRVNVMVALFGPERGRIRGQDTYDLKLSQVGPANLALARACGLLPLGLLDPPSRLRCQTFSRLERHLIVLELAHPERALLDQAAPSRRLATVFKLEADLKAVRGLEALYFSFEHRTPLGSSHRFKRMSERYIGKVQGGPPNRPPVRSTNSLDAKAVLAYPVAFQGGLLMGPQTTTADDESKQQQGK